MNYSALQENAGQLVTLLFEQYKQLPYPYHNLAHTKAVVQHAKEIALFYALDERETCIISIAAWFHDTGHLYGALQGHEEKGVLIMLDYLITAQASKDFIELAGNCIMATKRTGAPNILAEKIICDADTFHFGTAVFRETEFLMQKEMEMRTGNKFPHWHSGSLLLLQNHVFYTEYCQLLLNPGKKENIEWLTTLVLPQQQ